MNWKNRLTNYNFWISIFSAVLLILQALKIEFDIAYVNEIFTAVLGLLVVIGIISDPTRTSVKNPTESNQQVKEVEKAEVKQESNLPIVKEDEIVDLNSQNDIKVILSKISTDIEGKIQEMRELNKEAYEYIQMKKQNSAYAVDSENEKQNEIQQIEDGVSFEPAAAEMENPYLDLMKQEKAVL